MPSCNTLFIGTIPKFEVPAPIPEDSQGAKGKPQTIPAWTVGEKQGLPVVTDVNQIHPLTQLVQMGNVKVAFGRPLKGPHGTAELIHSDIGTLYAIGSRAGYEDAVLGFGIIEYDAEGKAEVNTDWFRRRSFPVFVMNAVKYLGGVRSSLVAPNIIPGSPAILRTSTPVQNIIVSSPRGDRFDVPREQHSTFVFSRTDELGVYDVREGSGNKVTQQFAVNLFDTRESDLTPAEQIDIGHEEVKAQPGQQTARKELWKWLLLGCIAVLIFEWYIYNRRVYL